MDRSRKFRTFLFILCITICIICLYSISSDTNDIQYKNNNDLLNIDKIKDYDYYKQSLLLNSESVSYATSSSVLNYHVTKSLSELGTTPFMNNDMLFFNRVPKSGSEMLVLLITWLQGENGFRHFRLPGGRNNNDRRLSRLDQETMIEDIKESSKTSAMLTSFDRHVYFTNFSSFGTQNPIYINLIRDPIDKMLSRFYYADLKRRREPNLFDECVAKDDEDCQLIPGHNYDLTIPYFCGHDNWCTSLNNKWALEKAKSNVEKYFKVVGVLEHLNETLSVLERYIPQYFNGLQNLYFLELSQPHHNKNKNNPREIKASTKLKLESSLKLEYEFYNFIKSRLLNQYVQ